MRVCMFILSLFLTLGVVNVACAGCITELGTGLVWRSGNVVKIKNIFGFKRKPTAGSDVSVVPYGNGNIPAFKLKVLKSRVAHELEHSFVEIELSDVPFNIFKEIKAPNPRVPEFLSNVMIILPTSSTIPRLTKPTSSDLPKNVLSDIVEVSASLSGNDKLDVLIAKFTCEGRRKVQLDDEMICSEYWQKINDQWVLCNISKPL